MGDLQACGLTCECHEKVGDACSAQRVWHWQKCIWWA